MYDPDVFAVLVPCDKKNKARTAFRLKHNERRFVKATAPGVAEQAIVGSRDPTPAPQSPGKEDDDDDDTGAAANASFDRIVLRFSNPPKNTQEGFQLGTDPARSDVLLGSRGTKGISGRQCNIATDDNDWIWLHDYHSTYGTAVGYDDEKKDEVRTNDTWILSYGPGDPKRWEDVTVYAGGLAFKIEFPNHEAARPQYITHLCEFREQCRTAVPPVEALALGSNPSTAAPSQARTPSERAIYLEDDEPIGTGQFGEVRKVVKVRDGQCYAAKRFFPPPRKRKRDAVDWSRWLEGIRNEIAIMRNNPHVSAPCLMG